MLPDSMVLRGGEFSDGDPIVTVEYRARFRRENGDYRVIGLKTPHVDLDIYVSPTGKSVRVFRDHKELKGGTD